MRALKLISWLLIVSLVTPGCSAFRSSTQMLSVTTDQADAEIYINGVMAGKGTANMPVKRNQNVQIMAKKPGYVTVQRSVGKSMNVTGVLDIVGGVLILLPLFGLLAPGAYSLDEENVSIMMVKE
ncbi:MAG: PEGA domain-containing protein [Candidatus Omnitrophica bacterium]|nr:PEGA domain-containing protein [Candidatus Omnitrophota bacterium]